MRRQVGRSELTTAEPAAVRPTIVVVAMALFVVTRIRRPRPAGGAR